MNKAEKGRTAAKKQRLSSKEVNKCTATLQICQGAQSAGDGNYVLFLCHRKAAAAAQQHLVASWKPFWAPTRQRPQANFKAAQSLTNQEKVTLIRTVRQFKYSSVDFNSTAHIWDLVDLDGSHRSFIQSRSMRTARNLL